MFMTLTNAAVGFEDQPIAIRKDIVLTVFQSADESRGRKTFVFAPPHGTWEVKETPAEVVKLLNKK